MKAIRDQEKDNKANEIRVVNQFLHGIHDRLVKLDVKKYVSQAKGYPELCGKDVLQTAQFYAEQHEVDTNYSKSYKESWNLINGLSNQNLSVADLNTEKKWESTRGRQNMIQVITMKA